MSKTNPDQAMIMQLTQERKNLKERDICFKMFISFAWSIDFKYINNYVTYSNIHLKLLPKQQMQN